MILKLQNYIIIKKITKLQVFVFIPDMKCVIFFFINRYEMSYFHSYRVCLTFFSFLKATFKLKSEKRALKMKLKLFDKFYLL